VSSARTQLAISFTAVFYAQYLGRFWPVQKKKDPEISHPQPKILARRAKFLHVTHPGGQLIVDRVKNFQRGLVVNGG